jgi:transcription antitermination factor NusB
MVHFKKTTVRQLTFIILTFIVSTTFSACGQTKTKSNFEKTNIDIVTVDFIEIRNRAGQPDTLENQTKRLTNDQKNLFSEKFNSSKSNGLRKAIPLYFIDVHLKDEEDKEYALKLLHETILGEKKFRDLIEENTDKWDFERIAVMDLIIMQVALAEIFTFESIPTSVSLNEYIDIAKSYSTPKSGTFINGILDAIVHKIKNENLIFKN